MKQDMASTHTSCQYASTDAARAAAGNPLAQFAQQLSDPAQQLNGWLATASLAELQRAIANAPQALAQLLRIQLFDPMLLIDGLRAVRKLSSHPHFDGDPTAWFAAQAGLSYKLTNQLAKTATWLYDPRTFAGIAKQSKKTANGTAFGLDLTKEKLQQIRKQQTELRELFREYGASAHVIVTCMQQTAFLATQARLQTGFVIRRVFQRLGQNPNPHLVLEYLRAEVKSMNFAFKDKVNTQPRPTMRISRPDILGQQVIEVHTSAEQAGMIREAVSTYAQQHPDLFDPAAPKEVRHAQALAFICADSLTRQHADESAQRSGNTANTGAKVPANLAATSTNTTPGVQYNVRVTIPYTEFVELCNSTDAHRNVPTDAGGRVRWDVIAKQRLNPIDAIAVIGTHGTQLHEAPWNRFFSPEQRDWVKAFQPYCAYPGCRVPAANCQAHHIIPVSSGGPTTTANEVLVCKKHHLLNDDTWETPGRFHYAKDALGIPYLQEHPKHANQPMPPPRYNTWNLDHSPVLKTLHNSLSRGRNRGTLAAALPTGDGVIMPATITAAIAAARGSARLHNYASTHHTAAPPSRTIPEKTRAGSEQQDKDSS